ncbi:MAG: hypothetical protein Q4G09_01805 [Clostridia bacterium]|nr:hypothetical protein [Clostridia bacterium]
MIKKMLKKQNGFAASDGLTAIIIIALFTGIIATIIYNIYLSNTSIKRMGTATAYITNIIEYTEKAYYDDVSVTGLENYINEQASFFDTGKNKVIISSNNTEQQIGNGSPAFTIEINIEYYNETEGNTDKKDLVKKVSVTVTYKLGNKQQEISMFRIKLRETLATPNKPDLKLLTTGGGYSYPIRQIDNQWKVCDEKDTEWYNYENGYWATVMISEDQLDIGDEVSVWDAPVYFWIPRYAYDTTNNSIEFLYSNTDKYVYNNEGYNSLEDTNFDVLEEFTNELTGESLTGIWVNIDSENLPEAYSNLDTVYPRKGIIRLVVWHNF